MNPDEWLCAALSVRGVDKAFSLLSLERVSDDRTHVRVLHKETGVVWSFECATERPTAAGYGRGS